MAKRSTRVVTTSTTNTKTFDKKTGEVIHRTESISHSKISNFSLAGLIVFILIIVSVIGIMSGRGDQRTFYSFLEMLSNVPVVEFGFNTNLLNYNVDWPTWLNWAEVILEVLVRFVGLLAFFVQGLVNSVLYIYYFLRWVFVV